MTARNNRRKGRPKTLQRKDLGNNVRAVEEWDARVEAGIEAPSAPLEIRGYGPGGIEPPELPQGRRAREWAEWRERATELEHVARDADDPGLSARLDNIARLEQIRAAVARADDKVRGKEGA